MKSVQCCCNKGHSRNSASFALPSSRKTHKFVWKTEIYSKSRLKHKKGKDWNDETQISVELD